MEHLCLLCKRSGEMAWCSHPGDSSAAKISSNVFFMFFVVVELDDQFSVCRVQVNSLFYIKLDIFTFITWTWRFRWKVSIQIIVFFIPVFSFICEMEWNK